MSMLFFCKTWSFASNLVRAGRRSSFAANTMLPWPSSLTRLSESRKRLANFSCSQEKLLDKNRRMPTYSTGPSGLSSIE